jgi:hypothetical protein
MAARMPVVTSLPRIMRYLDSVSSEGSQCPHCGADGRTIHRFVCEDGTTRGAMSGCVKLYPISPLAREAMTLDRKIKGYVKRGLNLASWDQDKATALGEFYAGFITEAQALAAIRGANTRASIYRTRRGWR